MAQEIELRVKTAIDTANSAQTLGEFKKSLLELQELAASGNLGEEQFKNLQSTLSTTTERMAAVKDSVGDIQDKIRTLEGTPVERLTGSFGLLKDAIFNLDFDKAKTAFQGFGSVAASTSEGIKENFKGFKETFKEGFSVLMTNPFGALQSGLMGLASGVKNLGTTFLSLGKALLTNPIFLLATAITLIVVGVIKLLDSFGLLMPILNAVKAAIGAVVGAFQALTDWLGLTTNAQNDYAAKTLEDGEAIKKSIQEQGAEREKLLGLVQNLTDEEIAAIEKKTGIQIENEKSIFDVKQETLEATKQQLEVEIEALKEIERAGGTLTEEQQKQLNQRLDDYRKTNAAIRENEIAKNAAIVEMNKKSAQTLRDLQLRNITDEIEKNRKLVEINKEKELRDIEVQISKAKKLGASTKELEAAKLEIEKFYSNESKKIDAQKAKEDADRFKAQQEQYKSEIGKQLKALQDSEKAKVSITEENTKERLNAELDAITKVEEFQKKNAKALGLSQDQLTIIYQENIDKRTALQKKFDDGEEVKNKKIVESANKEKLLTAEIAVLKATTEDEKLKKSIGVIEAQRDIELENTKLTKNEREKIELEATNKIKAINDGLTAKEKQNQEEKVKATLEANSTIANSNLETAELAAEKSKGNTEQEIAELENIKNLKITALDAEMAIELNNKNLSEAEKKAIEDKYRQLRLEAETETTESIKALRMAEVQAGLELGQQGLDIAQGFSDAFFTGEKNKNEALFADKLSKTKKGSEEEKKILQEKKKAEDKVAKEQFEINKALQIGTAIINGIQSILAITAVPDFTFGVQSAIRIGAQIALNAASIAKIASQKFQSSGGSADVGTTTTAAASGGGGGAPTPTFTPTQFFGLGQGAATTGGGQQNTRVYVSEGDITNTQNRVRVVEDRARFG